MMMYIITKFCGSSFSQPEVKVRGREGRFIEENVSNNIIKHNGI